MLKQRVITALVLGSSFIAAIYLLDRSAMAVILAIMILLGAWEWTRLCGFGSVIVRLVYCAIVASFLWIAWTSLDTNFYWPNLFVIAAVWWALALVWISSYPAGNDNGISIRLVKSFAGILVLLPCWLGMVKLHQVGPSWLLYVLLLVWVADSGAYFAGRAWGRHKLAPKVSPGKSWEGVYGALAASGLYSVAGIFWLDISPDQSLLFIGLSLLLVPVSVIGDLFESMIKRHGNFKDSGNLLPGHGGVLDRIDSWTAAVPVFVLAAAWLKLI